VGQAWRCARERLSRSCAGRVRGPFERQGRCHGGSVRHSCDEAPVSASRQTYCAWFSLSNIDLNLDQHRAHAFATAAVHALDAGANAATAHAAGLAAAGIH
jgi:hypothetical protein